MQQSKSIRDVGQEVRLVSWSEKAILNVLITTHIFQLCMVYFFLRNINNKEKAYLYYLKIVSSVGTVILYLAFIGLCVKYGDEYNLFEYEKTLTKRGMWLEVEIVTVPIMLVYCLLTYYIYNKEAEKNRKAAK